MIYQFKRIGVIFTTVTHLFYWTFTVYCCNQESTILSISILHETSKHMQISSTCPAWMDEQWPASHTLFSSL